LAQDCGHFAPGTKPIRHGGGPVLSENSTRLEFAS
jgi:hypothetical protein